MAIHRMGEMNIQPALPRLQFVRSLAASSLLVAVVLCSLFGNSNATAGNAPLAQSNQVVVVTIADWSQHTGTLRSFERRDNHWQPVLAATPVVIGKNGAAWGIGLHPAQAGQQKREGDGKSPAGVFALTSAFGYAETLTTAMPYQAMTATHYCVDVPHSALYNQIVDQQVVGAAAVADSTEPMRRDLHVNGDDAYRLGLYVAHNVPARASAGSCIFVHLWRDADHGTAGCTAMAPAALEAITAWLNPDQSPVLVLLPDAEYARLQADWALPSW